MYDEELYVAQRHCSPELTLSAEKDTSFPYLKLLTCAAVVLQGLICPFHN